MGVMKRLGTASAVPGEVATGWLEVGHNRDGRSVAIPVAVVNGVDSGRTLYIQAVSDGDELNGLGVVRRLVPRLDPERLTGTILIVGIANYFAFHHNEHRNPVDDTKLNRAYPGDSGGTSTERLARATLDIAVEADLALDLHQGSTSRMIEEVRVRCGRRHDLHEECLELAKVFDCGYVLDQKGPEGQLARVAPDEGVPTVDPELGASVGLDHESIQTGLEGIFNVLTYYEFIEGSVDPGTQTRVNGFDQYGAPTGGLVDLKADLGQRVSPGTPLYEVTDPFGEVLETVSADTDGILWRTRRLPQVATGEYVCSVGVNVDSY